MTEYLIFSAAILVIIGTVFLGVYRRSKRNEPWSSMMQNIEDQVDSLNHDPGPRHCIARSGSLHIEIEDRIDWINFSIRWSSSNSSRGDVFTTLQPPNIDALSLFTGEASIPSSGKSIHTGNHEFDQTFNSDSEGGEFAKDMTPTDQEDLIWFAQQSKGVRCNKSRLFVAAKDIETIPTLLERAIAFGKRQRT